MSFASRLCRAPRLGVAVALAAVVPGVLADQFLHVAVQEKTGEGEKVHLNLPLWLVQSALPAIQDEHFQDGKVVLGGSEDGQHIDLGALLEALAQAPEGDVVTLRSGGESVRARKQGHFFLVDVDEKAEAGGTASKIRVRLPLRALEEAYLRETNELDVAALMRALAREPQQELITVDDADSSVRIWIDDEPGQP